MLTYLVAFPLPALTTRAHGQIPGYLQPLVSHHLGSDVLSFKENQLEGESWSHT